MADRSVLSVSVPCQASHVFPPSCARHTRPPSFFPCACAVRIPPCINIYVDSCSVPYCAHCALLVAAVPIPSPRESYPLPRSWVPPFDPLPVRIREGWGFLRGWYGQTKSTGGVSRCSMFVAEDCPKQLFSLGLYQRTSRSLDLDRTSVDQLTQLEGGSRVADDAAEGLCALGI